jgi:glycosyltransferase involved in cell wall biosynthesis
MSNARPALIVYRHGVDYPNKQAHAVQMTHAVRGLADAGAEVWLSVGKLTVEPNKVWQYFGLEPHPGVKVLQWARKPRGLRDWKGGLFRAVIRHKLRKHRDRRPVFYLRDKDTNFETILEVARMRQAINARIVLESHACHADYLRDKLDGAKDEAERERIRAGKYGRAAMLELQAVRAVDLFVAVSDNLCKRLAEAAGREGPTAVVRNGAPSPQVADVPLSARAGVVYVGHAYASKGLDDLIAAMAKLPGVPLKVVGCRDDEEKAKVQGWARKQGVEDRVTITGFVPAATVFEQMSRARVAVIPLKHGDGSPIKAFEYMSAGLPIVATDAPANIEIMNESKAGVVVPAQNPNELAKGIRRLLDDDSLAEIHRRNALEWIEHNNWTKRGERILKLLGG